MIYSNIVEGVFQSRPNRFIAEVLIDNKLEKVHVKNTSRMKELLYKGAQVYLQDVGYVRNRKTRYSLIAVYKEDKLINIDSQIPNDVVEEFLLSKNIYTTLRREVNYKNSRFDFYYENKENKGFIEVKGVTLEEEGKAMFPDAPTQRGTRHLKELIESQEEGYKSKIIFLVQMNEVDFFTPNIDKDKKFYKALLEAKRKGVEILVYNSKVTKNSIKIDKKIEYSL